MTHTLHRQGTVENLNDDYVILAMSAKGINEERSAEKLREVLRITLRHGPVNMGDMRAGNVFQMDAAEIIERVQDTSIVHAVFHDIHSVAQALKELKEADLGMSVVVSGLFEPVRECCKEGRLKSAPHTVEHSLGVWGRLDLLPESQILEISTMCGHGMVSFNLVKEAAEDVRKGRISPEKAAERLAKPCVCGIFNPARATRLLSRFSLLDKVSLDLGTTR